MVTYFSLVLLLTVMSMLLEMESFQVPSQTKSSSIKRLNRFIYEPQTHTNMAKKSKSIVLSQPCRENILNGIQQVADIVKVTLGPRGRNILLEKEYGSPVIVNDGVTIARNIQLKDKFHQVGAQLVQEVAKTSDDKAGDGTTSTTILTAEICSKGIEFVNQGHNPIPIQKGIQQCGKLLIEKVKEMAVPIQGLQDLINIATVATSGNSKMGEIIAKAFDKLGRNAAIVLEENPAYDDMVDFTEGYTFERGWANPYFLLGEDKESIEWGNSHILVVDHKLESVQPILPILEQFVKSKLPLVIIAEDFGMDAMQALLVNKMRGLLKVVGVKAPSFGERRKDYLKDIAIATNATVISKDIGMSLDEIDSSMLGSAKGVVIKKDRTSIITEPKYLPDMEKRISLLQNEIEHTNSKFEKEKLTERIAALSGGIARIMIGAATETEQKEKKMRYEDAINAVRAAVETGYVPGGGVTYLAISSPETQKEILSLIEKQARDSISTLDEGYSGVNTFHDISTDEMESEISLQKAGAQIVLDAMTSITKQLAANAGVNGNKIIDVIRNSGHASSFGWNAKTNKFGDLIKQGVIDPAKVVCAALDHSTSVASLILTTEAMMVEDEDDDDKKPAGAPTMPMM